MPAVLAGGCLHSLGTAGVADGKHDASGLQDLFQHGNGGHQFIGLLFQQAGGGSQAGLVFYRIDDQQGQCMCLHGPVQRQQGAVIARDPHVLQLQGEAERREQGRVACLQRQGFIPAIRFQNKGVGQWCAGQGLSQGLDGDDAAGCRGMQGNTVFTVCIGQALVFQDVLARLHARQALLQAQ
ncbi:hypothetical protein VI06_12270 [Aquitalea magnusonii]|nr:hypothetical protein VI06_12270 [Aquitalea magnusonii]